MFRQAMRGGERAVAGNQGMRMYMYFGSCRYSTIELLGCVDVLPRGWQKDGNGNGNRAHKRPAPGAALWKVEPGSEKAVGDATQIVVVVGVCMCMRAEDIKSAKPSM